MELTISSTRGGLNAVSENAQIIIVDGCKVKVNYLPQSSGGEALERIKQALLASGRAAPCPGKLA